MTGAEMAMKQIHGMVAVVIGLSIVAALIVVTGTRLVIAAEDVATAVAVILALLLIAIGVVAVVDGGERGGRLASRDRADLKLDTRRGPGAASRPEPETSKQ